MVGGLAWNRQEALKLKVLILRFFMICSRAKCLMWLLALRHRAPRSKHVLAVCNGGVRQAGVVLLLDDMEAAVLCLQQILSK